MRNLVALLALFLLNTSSQAQVTKFPDTAVPLPPAWQGPVFRLSQDYPTQPISETYPWLQLDPTAQPNDYMQAVLQYCLAGNVEVDWVVQNNQVRHWYHAPWMHWGNHGREPIRGLTFERMSQPGELAQTQTSVFQNWAVGFYNPPGGYGLFNKGWYRNELLNILRHADRETRVSGFLMCWEDVYWRLNQGNASL